jgi:hypothetical protein
VEFVGGDLPGNRGAISSVKTDDDCSYECEQTSGCKSVKTMTDRWTNGHKYILCARSNKETDNETDNETDKETDKKISTHTDIETDKKISTHTDKEK